MTDPDRNSPRPLPHATRRNVLRGMVGTALTALGTSTESEATESEGHTHGGSVEPSVEQPCSACVQLWMIDRYIRNGTAPACDNVVSYIQSELETLVDPEVHTFGGRCRISLPDGVSRQDILDWGYSIEVSGRSEIEAIVTVENSRPVESVSAAVNVTAESDGGGKP